MGARYESADVTIVRWREEYAPHFEALNREWIERHFVLEPADEAVFRDPYGAIVAPGGEIFFLVTGGEVLGTCALLAHGARTVELAKMAVSPRARGRGYGDRLIEAAVAHARAAGMETLRLVTNSSLAPALALYRKHGFREVPVAEGNEYARADVQMELDLRRDAVNLAAAFARIGEIWRPKVVAAMNGQEVKLVKLRGEFVWHLHEREDELFLVIRGRMRVEYRDRVVSLGPGELCVVPRGVEHRTAADEETELLLVEPAAVRNTGNVEHPTLTAPIGARL
jgi:mannose-6-phosphate isomerase-like protein (cupin superfamily)